MEKRDKPQKRPAGKATKRAVKKIGGAKTKPKEKIRRSRATTGRE